jgi:hypothetical protein
MPMLLFSYPYLHSSGGYQFIYKAFITEQNLLIDEEFPRITS